MSLTILFLSARAEPIGQATCNCKRSLPPKRKTGKKKQCAPEGDGEGSGFACGFLGGSFLSPALRLSGGGLALLNVGGRFTLLAGGFGWRVFAVQMVYDEAKIERVQAHAATEQEEEVLAPRSFILSPGPRPYREKISAGVHSGNLPLPSHCSERVPEQLNISSGQGRLIPVRVPGRADAIDVHVQ